MGKSMRSLPISFVCGMFFVVLAACSADLPRRSAPPRAQPESVSAFARDLKMLDPALDDIDARRAAEAQVVSLEYGRPGQPTPWRNPDSGNYGEVIAGPGRLPPMPGDCRMLKHTIYAKGQSKTVEFQACRDAEARWVRR